MRSAQYVQQTYTSPGHTNPSVGIGLAQLFLSLVARTCVPGARLCDLGCGNGYLAGLLGQQGYRVVGVDASTSAIEIAIKHYASDTVSFMCAPFNDNLLTRMGDDRFDMVISSDVIEHLYLPRQLPKIAADLLRPGGSLLVGTPYHGYWKNVAIGLLNKWDAHHTVEWDGGHIKFFSVATLGNLVREQGFEDLQFHFYGRVLYLWKNMICQARKPEGLRA